MKHLPQPFQPDDPATRDFELGPSPTRQEAVPEAAGGGHVFEEVGSILGEMWAFTAYGVHAAALDSVAQLQRVFGKRAEHEHREAP